MCTSTSILLSSDKIMMKYQYNGSVGSELRVRWRGGEDLSQEISEWVY